jgi:aminoglycoside phosphotransferase
MEQTLTTFLETWTGAPHHVQWYDHRPNPRALRRRGQQPWLGNIYLNAIFTPAARPEVFDQVQREFSRSVVPWRRPVQRAYVALATAPWSARWLAQVGVGIAPPLPDAEHLLIVPGNHKIRILDRERGIVYNVAKSGFPAHFMQRELAARRQAEALDLPVPVLLTIAEDGAWFSERYISGTPLNRLADPQVAERAERTAMNALTRLAEHTAEEVALEAYVAELQARIQSLLDDNRLLSPAQKQELAETVTTLVDEIQRLAPAVEGRITTALTHGDYQPGNILVDGERVWLIDWEYAGRRQVTYDALVYALRARFPHGLAHRLDAFVTQGPEANLLHEWTHSWRDADDRCLRAVLFWLEELNPHLEENANPGSTQIKGGLTIIMEEVRRWIGERGRADG